MEDRNWRSHSIGGLEIKFVLNPGVMLYEARDRYRKTLTAQVIQCSFSARHKETQKLRHFSYEIDPLVDDLVLEIVEHNGSDKRDSYIHMREGAWFPSTILLLTSQERLLKTLHLHCRTGTPATMRFRLEDDIETDSLRISDVELKVLGEPPPMPPRQNAVIRAVKWWFT